MASYNAQLKNGPEDDIYPIVRNVRAEMPQASFDLIDDVVVYVGPTTSDYVNGHRYQCVQNGSVYSWVDVTGENNTPVSGGNVNAFDGDLYTARLSDGVLTTVNFMPIRYSGDKDFNFGMKVTQATNTGAIAITCNNKAVWWSDGNLPPQFNEGNQAPAVSLPETTYMLRFHWDCDANALMGNAEYLYPAYGEMSPVDGSRGVFIKSGTTAVSSAMTISGGTVTPNSATYIYNHGMVESMWFIGSGAHTAFVYVSSGGIARDCHMSRVVSSGYSNFRVYDGGMVIHTTIYEAQSLIICSGGVALDTELAKGDAALHVASGGYASGVVLRTGAKVRAIVSSGGSLDNCTGRAGGALYIRAGGVAKNVVLDGGQVLLAGAVASITVSSGGSMTINGGGSADVTDVKSGGKLTVSSGGRAQYTTISSGASAIVYAEGVMNGGLIKSGGYVHCYADGTLVNLTVEEGATVIDDNV